MFQHRIVSQQFQSEYCQYFNKQRINQMQNEFECTKIKDGLYLGTLATTQDYQFLQINKFGYVINCSAEIPNYFDSHGIKYLKFKLIKERTHKLWDEHLKKLRKLEKFIEEAEEQSLCCIIFSASGNNRSLVMLAAYLMSKYRWTLCKTLEYVRSKNIFIGLSQHYITQLQMLQTLLAEEDKPALTTHWKGPYSNEEEEIISKTFINSQELPIDAFQVREKKQKRVSWQDRIDKQKKKESQDKKLKQTGLEQFKKIKSNFKFVQENVNPHPSVSTKLLKKELNESPLKKSQNLKKAKKGQKNTSISKMETVQHIKQQEIPLQNQPAKPKQAQEAQDGKYFSQKELIKLIKKNLKIKKEDNSKSDEAQKMGDKQNQTQNQKGVYRLTINNFIQPNINIMNAVNQKQNDKTKIPPKAKAREDKNGRAQSEKQTIVKGVNESTKGRTDKTNKSFKRNTENSPNLRQKKLQKAVSLQFRKNN